MCGDSISKDDFPEIEKALSRVVDEVRTLAEFETWLQSQKCIESVKLGDYLIKTYPPKREFIVEFRMNDGSLKTKAIDILILENQRFRLSELHDY